MYLVLVSGVSWKGLEISIMRTGTRDHCQWEAENEEQHVREQKPFCQEKKIPVNFQVSTTCFQRQ